MKGVVPVTFKLSVIGASKVKSFTLCILSSALAPTLLVFDVDRAAQLGFAFFVSDHENSNPLPSKSPVVKGLVPLAPPDPKSVVCVADSAKLVAWAQCIAYSIGFVCKVDE